MRKVTQALLAGAYLCLGLTVALVIWRGGGGAGAGVAALAGVLALALALQGLFGRGAERRALDRELTDLREVNRILADQLDTLYERMAGLRSACRKRPSGG